MPDLTDKIIYQRVRHALSPASDVLFHDALTIEERIRFRPDTDRGDGYLLPIGPRTLILRDKDEREIYKMDMHEAKPNHQGFDPTLKSTLVMILYLASNPKVLKGKVLELECQTGIGGLLGCIGLAGVVGQHTEPTEADIENILPEKTKFVVEMPPNVESLRLVDGNEVMINVAFQNVRNSGVSPSKVAVEELDWTKHLRISDNERYSTILGSDLLFSYPTAKELARTAAYMLEPAGTFLHISPDTRDDVAYLVRFMEKGYLMTATPGYLKLQTHEYKYQLLGVDEPEENLDDQELFEQNIRESTFESITAFHHPDYDGINGEYFFPIETGKYDGSSADTYLETEGGGSPW